MSVVILSALVPTAIAQRFFSPSLQTMTPADAADIEDEEFVRKG